MADRFLDIDQIKEVLVQYEATDHCGYRCGLKGLDDIMRIDKGSLAICVARPGSGKTTFLNYYSYLMAQNNGWKTLYIPFEGATGKQIKDLYGYYGDLEEVAKYSVILDEPQFENIEDLYNTIKEAKEARGIEIGRAHV